MRAFSKISVTMAVSCCVLLLVACGESTDPEGETQDFSGSYTLHQVSQGTVGGTLNELAGSTGTFTMTATTYEVSIDIPLGGTNLVDNGTYTAFGTSTAGDFTQQSSVNQALQYQGTYAWDSTTNRLTLDTSAQGIRTVLVLQRN